MLHIDSPIYPCSQQQPRSMTRLEPIKGLLDPSFKYIPSASTDVRATWIKFGWVPPVHSETHHA